MSDPPPPKGQYLTIYHKDYVDKPITKLDGSGLKQQFKDPVGEGFRHYLTLEEPDNQPPNEDGQEYLDNKFKPAYERLAPRYFNEPLDQDTIIKSNIVRGLVTEYQIRYCDIIKDIEFKRDQKNQKFALPEDIDIPYTTYLATYRNPKVMCPHAAKATPPIHPPTSLGKNEKINKILNVKTETSDYSTSYGILGEFILKHNIHGPVPKDCSHVATNK